MAKTRVILFSRTDCHLCDAARDVVVAECERVGVPWREVGIDSDPQLQARYGEYVPVVEVDGVVQGYWQIDPERVRTALAG